MKVRNFIYIVIPFLIACSNYSLQAKTSTPELNLATPEFNLVVNADETGGRKNYDYAYSPTIIKENNQYHLFFCSPGDVKKQSRGEWDYIRYATSADGKKWTRPVVAIKANSDYRGLDYSACDPSIVFFNGYYYLFYSGAEHVSGPVTIGVDKKEVRPAVIRVARSAKIGGPYLKYTIRGTWEADASDPAAIIRPFRNGRYGAGQQSVVVHDNQIWMWYLDDSFGTKKFYLLKSNNPIDWKPSEKAETDNIFVGLDVKFDPRTRLFWALGLPRVKSEHPFAEGTGSSCASRMSPKGAIVIKFSSDGVHWNKKKELVSVHNMMPWLRPEGGISSDNAGNLLKGETIFAFPAGRGDQSNDSVHCELAIWDLFSLSVENVSEKIFPSLKILETER